MNERILAILIEMDKYMPSGSMYEFLLAHRKQIRFNISLSKTEREESVESLELSVRASHCLRRAGYNTIGSLLDAIAVSGDEKSSEKLLKLRNLGKKSADEILLTLLCHQFMILPEKEKGRFMKELVEINSAAA